MRRATALRVRCPAKINLGFWILGRRPDGHHEVDTILQAVSLEDEILLEASGGEGLALETRGRPILGEGANIVERAWYLIQDRAGRKLPGIRVTLTKRIPVGGGLGGGSSDAAGFLLGADRLLGLAIGGADLMGLASRLGADVPFFMRGGTARGTGRGDRVRHLCPAPPAWIVLATPPVAVSTTWAYGRARIRLTLGRGAASMLAAALGHGRWDVIAPLLHNDFEDVVLPEFPAVAKLRRALHAGGALGSLLSGSGSTVFGLASTMEHARRLAERAAAEGALVHVVRTTERGVAVAGQP
ncbi:MAG: 4-(cytidine 5'-diphospho)-2-C-methyl-D-erythritol kinase [Candidatus Latescibacteria bacterium]|nr:4-(cytidine 5'-diphospho)-2-C-methyl-D-erythritol kinase [Candidatus Latescibacterota bacterium]